MKKQKNKGGRPKVEIDYNLVLKLSKIGCTQEEIATFMDCSVRTLLRDKEFCHTYKKGIAELKMSVRRKQCSLMMKEDRAMCIWLGKQLLGQSDKIENNNNNTHEINDELMEIIKNGKLPTPKMS